MPDIADIAREAGIIGAGGAGFPTHVKLANPVDTVIVNGAECEPLMFGDQYTMETRAGEMIGALRAIIADFAKKRGEKTRAVVGIKRKYKASVKAIRAAIGDGGDIEILELDNVYPAGDEQFLVYEATGRIVPEGGIPPMVGALVMNVGTLVNLAAAMGNKPVTHRLVTLGGAVKNPCVVSLPIGTLFADIAQKMEPLINDYALLVNGPMMGRIATTMDGSTTKTTGGLFVLPKDHSHVRRMTRPLSTEIRIAKSTCEVCRYCTDFCPRYLAGHSLEPHKIMRVINYDRDLDVKTITSAWLCCECGVCDLWACPMFLSPRVIFREFKRRLREAGIKNPHNRSELTADYYRQYRGVPTDRLARRLELSEYDVRPPFNSSPWSVNRVRIALNQHVGAPAVPIVKAGDRVRCGDLIAEIPEGKLGARYHASIDGTVGEVGERGVEIVG